MTALVEVRDLRAAYGDVRVLHGLDFAIEEGGVTTLLGANGAGKTTTLRALCGMIPTQGEIRFDGRPIRGWITEDIVRLGIAHVPEGRGTFVRLTVEENLALGASGRRSRSGLGADMERVYGYFPILKERRRQQAGTLSGGEQQMLAVGRALMLQPRLMLLDEPSFGLAPLVVREVFDILARHQPRREGVDAARRAERLARARPRRRGLSPRDRPHRHVGRQPKRSARTRACAAPIWGTEMEAGPRSTSSHVAQRRGREDRRRRWRGQAQRTVLGIAPSTMLRMVPLPRFAGEEG